METARVDEVVRIEGGRVLATLIRLTGSFDLAEDALQDACLEALARWPHGGVPDNPAAWLTTTARNRAVDRIRREMRRPDKEAEAMRLLDQAPPPPDGHDDRLRLIFTCAHPAIDPESRVALALRTICGLSTEEVAGVFLVKAPTMGQRLTRVKRKIAEARIPYRVPGDDELRTRLPAVLAVVYAVYTAGHHAPIGQFDDRLDLAREGLSLARLLDELMPGQSESQGLLALVLASEARRPARRTHDVVLLADQDRARWDRELISEAQGMVEGWDGDLSGPYRIQAAIALCHVTAPSFAATDWQRIARLYERLEAVQPSIAVRVNRAVAIAHASGPAEALASIADVESDWHYVWASRADFHQRLGNDAAARECLRRSLAAPMNETDRKLLEERLAATGDLRP
jgi:RNA polymerase sigma-70 factor, ECF subfamily